MSSSPAAPVADTESASSPVAALPPWPLGERLAFRFFFTWITLFIFPFPAGTLPGLGWLATLSGYLVGKPFNWIEHWTAPHLLRYRGPLVLPDTGSGDRITDWIDLFNYLFIAACVAILWSLAELGWKRARRHDRLLAFLRVYVRYYLAAAMLLYGLGKLFMVQMPPPSPFALEQPFGQLSPNNLLWSFMGTSPAYERFSGLAETLGAVLLLARRTTLLGALVLAGVLVNVVMLNLCYDTPVKQYSSLLLLLSLFVVLPDVPRLVSVLLLRRPTPAPAAPRLPSTRARRRLLYGLETAIGLGLVYCVFTNSVQPQLSARAATRPPSFEGRWAVDRFVKDGREVPPLLAESTRWRSVTVFTYSGYVMVRARRVDDESDKLHVNRDGDSYGATWLPAVGAEPIVLHFAQPDADHLTLDDGKGGKLAVMMHRLPPRQYLLQTRGFHWVND